MSGEIENMKHLKAQLEQLTHKYSSKMKDGGMEIAIRRIGELIKEKEDENK